MSSLFVLLSLLNISSSVATECDFIGALRKVLGVNQGHYYQINNTQFIQGKNSTILKLSDDYNIHLIESSDGTLHAFDSEHVQPRILEDTREPPKNLEQQVKPVVEIDKPRAKKLICGQYLELAKNKNFKKMQRSLEEIISKEKLISGTDKCLKEMGYFSGSYVLWFGTSGLRAAGIHNKLTENGDNFYMTIPLMVMINRCLKKSPVIGMAGGALANILEEVSANGRSLDQITKRKNTDWADLNAGMSAVGTYALWRVLSEKYFSFRFDRACLQ